MTRKQDKKRALGEGRTSYQIMLCLLCTWGGSADGKEEICMPVTERKSFSFKKTREEMARRTLGKETEVFNFSSIVFPHVPAHAFRKYVSKTPSGL